MIEILDAPDHIVALRMSDRLTAHDYERIFSELDAKLKDHERIGVYTDARELRGITPSGLGKDLQYTFAKIGEYRRFARAAVVTDKPLLRVLARTGDALFSQIELRTFTAAEQDAALSWVSELPDQPRVPALRVIETTRPDTVAFAWNGLISTTEAAELVRALGRAIDHHGTIRLLARIERLGGIAPGVFTETGLIAFKRRARDKVQRYAVVGGPTWLPRWIATAASLFKVDVRHFARADENAAWAWLEAQPATAAETLARDRQEVS
jgi:hypothetical protein